MLTSCSQRLVQTTCSHQSQHNALGSSSHDDLRRKTCLDPLARQTDKGPIVPVLASSIMTH